MRLVCFGGLSCPEPYTECPCADECRDAFFRELAAVPLEAWHAVQELEWREYCRRRVKTYAWECKVKEPKK